MLKNLRAMLHRQQFETLVQSASEYFESSRDVQVLPLMALACVHQGQSARAQELLDQIAPRRDELNLDTLAELAAVMLLLGQTEPGRALLITVVQQMPQQAPQQAFAHAQLAWLAQSEGRMDEALIGFRLAFAQMPGMAWLWFNLIRLLLVQGHGGEAQAVLDHAMAQFQAYEGQLDEVTAQQQKAGLHGLQLEICRVTGEFLPEQEYLGRHAAPVPASTWIH